MLLQKKIYFKGINFFNLDYSEIKKKIKKGGLLVIPSGPGLSTLDKDKKYHIALKNSDIALFDSGYFCLLLIILKFINVKKFSGYKLLKNLFNDKSIKHCKFFLVDPSYKESIQNKKYLSSIKIKNSHHYVAPIYRKQNIHDSKLLSIINKKKPKFIMINLGGNVQEVLGYYLKKKLRFNPIIICSGAAISYFTKQQAPINNFLDAIYLGWLIRIVFNPKIFLLRYLKAFKLLLIVYNNKIIVQ
jgi:N-acetylglucosaminyldiphosphoundecaprenol N-acetyl-beta-D-mannosaminyltransferase|tara:strand:- start:893 stop:1624 length:732 start_codon:yes stop_codon:yes gene_type:complete